MSRDELKTLLRNRCERVGNCRHDKPLVPAHEPESHLIALFDNPLQVCAWLAEMKAGMWVRNGLGLRNQKGTYRGVSQRDLANHRDIFLLQTAVCIWDPKRVLASLIECYGMNDWMRGGISYLSWL